ncbi:hypothetical protein HDU98_010720 [Podochytrium sp. JEL0797]|nr:hypothetical protein HDU98_010720 [Podochytrium sp. JEL0797]
MLTHHASSSTTLSELSLSLSPSHLQETFGKTRIEKRSQAKRDVTIVLPRLVHVLQHLLSSHVSRPPPNAFPTNEPAKDSASPKRHRNTDATVTPKKRRRVSNMNELMKKNEDKDDDENLVETPVPHPEYAEVLFGGNEVENVGVNEDIKELMRTTKRHAQELSYCISNIKTWLLFDHIQVPQFEPFLEIEKVEKWILQFIESLSAYHAKRATLLRDSHACPFVDAKEAVFEIDDQMMYTLVTMCSGMMQVAGLFYDKLEGVVVDGEKV